MYAFLSLVVLAAGPDLYVLEDKGEIEFRSGSEKIVVNYYGDTREIEGDNNDVISILDRKRVKIPQLDVVSKMKAPTVTVVDGEIRVRFPIQYFGKEDFYLAVIGSEAVITKTLVTVTKERIPVNRK
jgi:hypothetical protein